MAESVVVTSANQDDYDETAYADYEYSEEDWYGEEEWHEEEEHAQPTAADTEEYPWNLWNLIYLDIKLEEHPQVIHDVCVALQAKQILHPWQLTYLSRDFLEKIFPTSPGRHEVSQHG